MKQILKIGLTGFFVLSLLVLFIIGSYAKSDNEGARTGTTLADDDENDGDDDGVRAVSNSNARKEEMTEKIKEFKDKIKDNKGMFEFEGKSIKIREMNEEKKEIVAGKINAKTGLNLTAEDIGNGTAGQILRAYFSNGRYAIIKIMPDRATVKAVERLNAKCLERNCTVELKEFKIGNRTIAGYEVETEKDSRLFLIFNKKIKVRAVVDAETGEIILIKKPWWAFLVKEKDEKENEIDEELGIKNESEGGNETGEVLLCHIPPGNPKAAHRILVGRSAVSAHLAHGDYYGECAGTSIGNESTGNLSE